MSLPRKKRPFGRFIPSFESLESRTVPTGNVTTSIVDGVLHVVGDAEGNEIRIVQGGTNGVSVQPIDSTTINGQASAQTFDHISGLYLSMGAGDNVLQVDGLNLGQAINISGVGGGNNNISVTNTHIHNYLAILTGSGDDTVSIDHVSVRKKLDMNMGDGNDTLNLTNSSVGKKSYIDGNGGDNTLNGNNNHYGEHTQILNFGTISHSVPPTANNDTATVAEGGTVNINVAANDTTPSGTIDLTSIVITTQPTHGTLTVNADGTVTYVNDNSANASDSFQYTIKNSAGITSNVATVSITVTLSQNPIANDDTATVARNGTVTIVVSGNDVSPTGTLDLASIVITTQPSHGTVTVNNNGTVAYTNNGDPNTPDTFQYTIADTQGHVSNVATVTVTITDVPPVANNDTATVARGGSSTINVAANDSDPDGTLDLTSIQIVSQPTDGTVTVHNDGTVTYTNNGNTANTDSFTYTIKDNAGLTSNVATVNITVDTPPVANDDTAVAALNAATTINVAANDSDPDGTLDLTSIQIGTQPLHGTLTVNNDGTVTYTNNGDAATTDSFTYTIKDNAGLTSNVATVNITVDAAPVAADDFASIVQGESANINVAANDSDSDGTLDLTSIVITTQPQHGTVTVHADGTVTYQNDNSANTSDTFQYTIKDNAGLTSNAATVSISINLPPTAGDDSARVNPGGSVNINVIANDSDPDGTIDPTSIVITSPPAHGTATPNPDGTVTYVQDGSAATGDSFQYTVLDNQGAVSNTATVTITVNHPPQANPDGALVAQGGTRTINVAANDTDSDGTLDLTSIQIVQQPQHGTVTVNNDGTVTYHSTDVNATADSFSYTIKDNEGAVSNVAPVTIELAPNIAPIAVADFFTVHSGVTANLNVSANDFDVDGTLNLASIHITVQPLHGTLMVNPDGTVTYVNDGLGATSDTFSYTIADDLGAVSNVAQVFITIPPTA
jgi:ribosomal protein L24E